MRSKSTNIFLAFCRLEELMDMAQNGNFGFPPYFSGLGIDIKLDIVAIDHYDGVISTSNYT